MNNWFFYMHEKNNIMNNKHSGACLHPNPCLNFQKQLQNNQTKKNQP